MSASIPGDALPTQNMLMETLDLMVMLLEIKLPRRKVVIFFLEVISNPSFLLNKLCMILDDILLLNKICMILENT